MKTCALFTAALVATASAQDATALKKCAETVTVTLAAGALAPEAATCAKEAGVSVDPTATPTDADLTKILATKSCTTWWDGVVTKVKAISPPCDFPTGATTVINTAKFNWSLKDLYAFAKTAAETTAAPKPSSGPTPKPAGNGTTAKPDAVITPAKPATTTTTAAPATTVKSSAAAAAVSVVAVAVVTMMM